MTSKQFNELQKRINQITNSRERLIAQEYLDILREIKRDLSDVFEKYADNGIVKRKTMAKYGRLQKLENEIIEKITKLTKTEIELTKGAIVEVFEESFYRSGFMIETQAKIPVISLLTKETIDAIIFNDMDAIKWDERSRDNAKVMIRQLKEEITRGLVQGWSYGQMAKAVSERLEIGRKKATRIVQTETHRASNQANLKAMKDAADVGVEMRKRWLSTLDSRTRDSHKKLDGQTVGVDDYFTFRGKKAQAPSRWGDPKEDINCRCTTISVFEGLEPKARKARPVDGKRGEMIEYQNYDEWKKTL